MTIIDTTDYAVGPYTVTHRVTFMGVLGKDESDAASALKHELYRRLCSDNIIIDNIFEIKQRPLLYKNDGIWSKIFGNQSIFNYDITVNITTKRCDYQERDVSFEHAFMPFHIDGVKVSSTSKIIKCNAYQKDN